MLVVVPLLLGLAFIAAGIILIWNLVWVNKVVSHLTKTEIERFDAEQIPD